MHKVKLHKKTHFRGKHTPLLTQSNRHRHDQDSLLWKIKSAWKANRKQSKFNLYIIYLVQNKQCILNFECTSVPWSHLHHSDETLWQENRKSATSCCSSHIVPLTSTGRVPLAAVAASMQQSDSAGWTHCTQEDPPPPISHCVVQSANELRASLWPRLHHPEHTELLSGAVTGLFFFFINFFFSEIFFLTFKKNLKVRKNTPLQHWGELLR